jgi:hypothetical protein
MKLWLKTNVFVVEEFLKLNQTPVAKKLVINVTLILPWIAQMLDFWEFMPNLITNQS